MRIDLTIPGGGELHFERKPMPPERFEALCWLAGILGVAALLTYGFSLLF